MRSEIKLKKMTLEELGGLSNYKLIKRMDEIIESESLDKRGLQIMKFNISSIMKTKKVNILEEEIQRKLAYKIFGMILQIEYNKLALLPHPKLPGNQELIKQFSWAERKQWMIISSRIIFEYFMEIIYMINQGKKIEGNSKFKAMKSWLKESSNKFNYFAISIARAAKYSRHKREPEIHATTRLAREVLTLSPDEIDNSIYDLINIIMNQWQHVIDISDDKNPNGYSIIDDEFDDKGWYELLDKGSDEDINAEIDRMFAIVEP